MSMFSDIGKTVSAGCRAVRGVAELAEKTVGDDGLVGGIVGKSADIMNVTLDNVCKQAKMEGELDMLEFKSLYNQRKKELSGGTK